MSDMQQSKDNKFIPITSVSAGKGVEVRPDVFYITNQIVNVIFVGDPAGREWVLIDAGMPFSADIIQKAARKRFPNNDRPSAIFLTHGHFDHVGAIVKLIEQWETPVYAHSLEFPYLNGTKAYPEPDNTVEGGMLAKLASVYPHEPIDIAPALVELPADGHLPGMEGWQWVHTPGHTPGHVSFFRPSDGVLVAGDAFVTVKQDELYKVLLQKKEVNGPPRYLTTDWVNAEASVRRLQALQPRYAITGHGTYMEGDELNKGLLDLINNFQRDAVPSHGKFV